MLMCIFIDLFISPLEQTVEYEQLRSLMRDNKTFHLQLKGQSIEQCCSANNEFIRGEQRYAFSYEIQR